jgi:hypothetical protein
MRIAYLTTDEVNRSWVQRMAAACGLELSPLEPRDAVPEGGFDAVLYDLDHLPPSCRHRVVSGLLRGAAPGPTAVHGYALQESQAADLRRHDVAVYRDLQPELFWLLRLAAQSRSNGPPNGKQEEEAEWSERLERRLEELKKELSRPAALRAV